MRATPAASHVFSSRDASDPLEPSLVPIFRSILGAMLYVSHERCDIQFTTKCLASYLKAPIKNSWQYLGRLLGYLKGTSNYGVCMVSTNPGVSLFEKLNGITEVESDKSLVETFTDADWQGGGSAKSTNAGCHFVNGLLVHTSSRTQHVRSLSSTGSEFYGATSGAIDTIYLKNIIEFLTDKPADANSLTDNSASRQIANKLGTSRLRRKGGVNILRMIQVGTLWNPADLGTKNLPRDRHVMLLFMLGMVDAAMSLANLFIYHRNSKNSTKGQFVPSKTCLFTVKTVAVFFHLAPRSRACMPNRS